MKTIALIALTLIPFFADAQFSDAPPTPPVPPTPPTAPSAERKERIESMKIGFLTKELDLTSKEAQVFWPVYNEFNDEMDKIREEKRAGFEKGQDIDSMSDKQVESLVDSELNYDQKILDLKKKYHGKFKSVLPIRKVAKLYRAEDHFRRDLLKQMKSEGKQGKEGKDKRKEGPAPR